MSACANVVPLYLSRHLPFSDLPEHLAVIATMRHYWDPAWRSRELFVIQPPSKTQYLLYDAVAAALAVPFGSAERANLLLLSCVALALPFALRALARAVDADPRVALFGCPLFWSRAIAEGLVNFVASIPVAVFALALAVQQVRAPRPARGFGVAALGVGLFYLHLSSVVVLALGTIAFALLAWVDARPGPGLRRGAAWALPRVGWLAALTLPAAVFAVDAAFLHPDPARRAYGEQVYFLPTGHLLRALPAWVHDFWTSRGDDALAALMWVAFAVLVVLGRRDDARPPAFRRAGLALVLVAAALYFTLPSQIGHAFELDLRMAPFIALFAALLLRPRPGRATGAAFALAGVAGIALGAHGAIQMARYERDEGARVDEVLSRLPRGKRLLALMFDPSSRYVHVDPFLHTGGYYAARYGGLSSFSFAELPHWPIQYRPEAAPPAKAHVFWDQTPCAFRNSVDGDAYDFVLVRGSVDPFEREPPGPRWRVLAVARELTLYARETGERVALAAPDKGPCAAD
jgi:hypothetical protein